MNSATSGWVILTRKSLAGFHPQIDTNTKQFFTEARQALADEEQSLGETFAQRKSRAQSEHQTEVATLDQKSLAIRGQLSPAMSELSQKLQQAQKQLFGFRWQTAKHEKDGQRFSSLSFGHYLRKVLTG